eukprot:4874775-Karenia_brevis.AAC.1
MLARKYIQRRLFHWKRDHCSGARDCQLSSQIKSAQVRARSAVKNQDMVKARLQLWILHGLTYLETRSILPGPAR